MILKKKKNYAALQADFGNALVCPLVSDSTRYTQVGILLWDVQCDTQDVSGIYIDIIENREWINQVLSSFKNNESYKAPKGNYFER